MTTGATDADTGATLTYALTGNYQFCNPSHHKAVHQFPPHTPPTYIRTQEHTHTPTFL